LHFVMPPAEDCTNPLLSVSFVGMDWASSDEYTAVSIGGVTLAQCSNGVDCDYFNAYECLSLLDLAATGAVPSGTIAAGADLAVQGALVDLCRIARTGDRQ